MIRNGSPSLFITVDSLQGHSEEFGELFLCFAQFLSCQAEFYFGQE